MAEILQGDGWLATMAAVVLLLVLVTEQVLTTRGVRWYFRLGFPLGADLVPLPHAPTGEGEVQGVRWAVEEDGASLRFWAEGHAAPRGLHGVVWLRPDRHGRVHLEVRWAPWLTPLAAAAWLSVVGMSRGEAWFAVPLALMWSGALLWFYWQTTGRLAAALRWSWLSDGSPDPEPRQGQGGRPS